MQARYRRIREAAYQQGRAEFITLSDDPTFRDFVTLFIEEGTKRSRNTVAVANSDPAVIVACVAWLRRLTDRRLDYAVQVHEDQDLEAVRAFWSCHTGAPATEIRLQRKTNSGRLNGRNWRSEHGVLTVRCHDTCLRARMQAWMDELHAQWLTLTGPGA